MSETCENCGKQIGDLETPHVFQGHIVCAECDRRLRQAVPRPATSVPSPGSLTANTSSGSATVSQEVRTNVKQGGLIGAVACFTVAVLFGCLPMGFPAFLFYAPLFFAAFVLSIVAMAQKRVVGGLALLLLTVVFAPLIPAVRTVLLVALMSEGTDGQNAYASKPAPIVSEDVGPQERYQAVTEEIRALKEKFRQSEAEWQILDQVEITWPSYYWSDSDFISEPVISFVIRNANDFAIRRIYCRGVVYTPGRTLPWIDENFNYELTGGLEPGEHRTLKLAPNRFGPWGDTDLRGRNDLTLKISLYKIEDAQGNEIESRFTEEDRIRLEQLHAEEVRLRKEVQLD